MGKIFGDPKVIEIVEKMPAGSPANLVCLDAIKDLPETLSGYIIPVPYTVNDFEEVGGGNYMPSPDLVNRICEARGIFGCDGGTVEPFYLEIDWNRLACKFDEPPKMVRMHVGYIAKKRGQVMMEDGVMRTSDECVVLYNAWERLCADRWGPEEAGTNFYDPKIVKTDPNGSRYYEYSYYDKNTKKTVSSKKYLKYDTRSKRQLSFDEELKFAQRKADTKARNVVIRVITGMNTGYTKEDLKAGCFYFHRIQRSEWSIKAEQAAYLKRITDPQHVALPSASSEVFDSPHPIIAEPVDDTPPDGSPESQPEGEPEAEPETKPEATHQKTPQQMLIDILVTYKKQKLIPEARERGIDSLLEWLNKTKGAEKSEYWEKALKLLSVVEEGLPEDKRIEHAGLEVGK